MKDRYPHIVVGVFIQRKDGKIALFKSPKWPELWVPPGGHIDYGEKIEEAVRREVKEEVGIDIYKIKFLRFGEMLKAKVNKKMPHLIYFHYSAFAKSENFILDQDEITDYKWFSKKEIITSDFFDDRTKDSVKLIK